MEKTIITPEPFTEYTFTEKEFKDKLGIEDTQGVLNLAINYLDGSITVTMRRND
jgi:hypothetical protein